MPVTYWQEIKVDKPVFVSQITNEWEVQEVFCRTSLDSFQLLQLIFRLRAPHLRRVSQVRSNQGEIGGSSDSAAFDEPCIPSYIPQQPASPRTLLGHLLVPSKVVRDVDSEIFFCLHHVEFAAVHMVVADDRFDFPSYMTGLAFTVVEAQTGGISPGHKVIHIVLEAFRVIR